MLKPLTNEQITALASRKGVKKVAVENFLMTVDTNQTAGDAYENLSADARSYRWNAATTNAIRAGILLASKV